MQKITNKANPGIKLTPPTSSTSTTKRFSRLSSGHNADLARGAHFLGLHLPGVYLDADIIREYTEVDHALGQNVIGTILSVLAYELSVRPNAEPGQIINVRSEEHTSELQSPCNL